jgi:hypothetical protein
VSASVSHLSGKEWQLWANKLLMKHYGPAEYQPVPDHDRGDAGIEGFTVTSGHCYQAYGCVEPISTRARYIKQRDKITTDVAKFIANRPVFVRTFGPTVITRWVLFVPYADSKEIIVHASTKTAEVLSEHLPYVGEGFRVMVLQEQDFAAERDQLLSLPQTTLDFVVQPTTEEAIAAWAETNDRLAATLFEKIQRLPTLRNSTARQHFHQEVLKWYIEGQSILDALREYPETYKKVIQTKAHRENFLVVTTISGRSPQAILTTAINQLYADLKERVSEVGPYSAEQLAHEGVAGWLLRCPLDY